MAGDGEPSERFRYPTRQQTSKPSRLDARRSRHDRHLPETRYCHRKEKRRNACIGKCCAPELNINHWGRSQRPSVPRRFQAKRQGVIRPIPLYGRVAPGSTNPREAVPADEQEEDMIRTTSLFPVFSRYTKWFPQAWILVSNEKHCSGSDAVAHRSRYSVSAVTTKSSNMRCKSGTHIQRPIHPDT